MSKNGKLRIYLLIVFVVLLNIRFALCPAMDIKSFYVSADTQVSFSESEDYMPVDYCFLSSLKLFETEQALLLRISDVNYSLAFLLIILLLILRHRHLRLDFLARLSKFFRYLQTCDMSSPFGGLSPPYSFSL